MSFSKLIFLRNPILKQLIRKDHHAVSLSQIYPKLGNRDIVGYGMNGHASYLDIEDYPCPAVRFRENSKEVLALREKEKGNWKDLSLDEKKTLYRASFCQTYAEFTAPDGRWKEIVAIVVFFFGLTFCATSALKRFVLPPMPHTMTEEWRAKEVEFMVKVRANPIFGIGSKYDYEKQEWKK